MRERVQKTEQRDGGGRERTLDGGSGRTVERKERKMHAAVAGVLFTYESDGWMHVRGDDVRRDLNQKKNKKKKRKTKKDAGSDTLTQGAHDGRTR